MLKPGSTHLGNSQGPITSNENKKIKHAQVMSRSSSGRDIVQVPCPSGHTVTGCFCKNSVLKNVEGFTTGSDQAKDGQGSIRFMTMPPLTNARTLGISLHLKTHIL